MSVEGDVDFSSLIEVEAILTISIRDSSLIKVNR